MSDLRSPYDNEIDLFELIETLWAGKAVIALCVLLMMAAGGGFVTLKEAVYQSKMNYSEGIVPPFYPTDSAKVLTDFRSEFYNRNTFNAWKADNAKSALVFDDLSNIQIINGFTIARDEDDLLAVLQQQKDTNHIQVNTNQLSVLNDFYTYAQFINAKLTDQYTVRALSDLKIIESRFEKLADSNETVIENILEIDRYVETAKSGPNALIIQRPTMPKKVSPKVSLTFALCLVLGSVFGAVVVLTRSAVRKRNTSAKRIIE